MSSSDRSSMPPTAPQAMSRVAHLTCYYWYNNGRCRLADGECKYAHHYTGVVAEEPIRLHPGGEHQARRGAGTQGQWQGQWQRQGERQGQRQGDFGQPANWGTEPSMAGTNLRRRLPFASQEVLQQNSSHPALHGGAREFVPSSSQAHALGQGHGGIGMGQAPALPLPSSSAFARPMEAAAAATTTTPRAFAQSAPLADAAGPGFSGHQRASGPPGLLEIGQMDSETAIRRLTADLHYQSRNQGGLIEGHAPEELAEKLLEVLVRFERPQPPSGR